MDYIHENIKTNEKLGFKLFSFRAKSFTKVVPKHWHNSIEILYVIEGSLNLWLHSQEYIIEAGNIILINSNEIHSTRSKEENYVITLQIPYKIWRENNVNIDEILFNLNSIVDPTHTNEYEKVKLILVNMINIYNSSVYGFDLKINSLILDLLFMLVTTFKVKKIDNTIRTQKYLKRLTEITEFIKDNYSDNITLDIVADKCNLTSQYLARFFRKYMDVTFLQYLNSIRLDSAYKYLVKTDYSMTRIALDSGFPNEKSFTKAFKDEYQVTPYQYKLSLNKKINPMGGN